MRRPLIIADRGASRDAPEHTIAAYELALSQGADGLWLDVHAGRDHHPVVIHDFTLDRTTDGAGPVADHDVRALKRLDAGAWWGPAFAGQRLQMLEEVLERFRDRARFAVALRGGLACYPELVDRVVGLLDVYGVTGTALVMSFDLRALAEARRLDDRVRVGGLAGAPTPAEARGGVGTVGAPESTAVALDAVGVSGSSVVAPMVQALGGRTACYALGVGDPAEAARLSELGVEAIVTDRPGPLVARLGR